MNISVRFAATTLLWAAGLAVLLVTVAAMNNEPLTSHSVIRWMAGALGLAMFPAGVSLAPALRGDSQWRQLRQFLIAAVALCVVILALSIAAPPTGDGTRGMAELWRTMQNSSESWETRNHSAWTLLATLLTGPRGLLLSVIGLQVGIWAAFSVPRTLRQPLYWLVGVGLLLSSAIIWDTTYETIVLHTEADASFAALYTLLLPLAVCAGLSLPTLAAFVDPVRFRS